jgi:hypothetical protein
MRIIASCVSRRFYAVTIALAVWSVKPGNDNVSGVSPPYLDVLASIYIYNEHRGYTSIDRVLEVVRARCLDDGVFVAAVAAVRPGSR